MGSELQHQWFPLYHTEKAQFALEGSASGARGATARVSFSLESLPHILYGISIWITYELIDEFFVANPDFKRNMRDGGVDFDFTIKITFTQQNITINPTPIASIQGFNNVNIHPFTAPYPLSGSNNIAVDLTRLSSYPTAAGETVAPFAHITLLTTRGVRS